MQAIDAQHKVLIESLNELHLALVKGAAREQMAPLLHNLLALARNHFASEAAILARAAEADLSRHAATDRNPVQGLNQYVARFERGEEAINLPLLQFLRDWLRKHIEQVDRCSRPAPMHGTLNAESLRTASDFEG
jgi:hemerythrin-like metal-binding protein